MTDINPSAINPSGTSQTLSTSDTADASPGAIDPKKAAGAAAKETSAVAHTAVNATKNVAHEAASQVANVASQTKDQIGNVVNQAKTELKAQADSRAEQAAAGLQTLADQLSALTEGRPNDAGHVGALVGDAQQRVSAYAQTLQDRGPQAVVQDLAGFARRRPLVFLFSAALAGFAVGRLARATAAVHSETSDESSVSDTAALSDSRSAAALTPAGSSGIMYGAPLS